jgi:hypothetical protein
MIRPEVNVLYSGGSGGFLLLHLLLLSDQYWCYFLENQNLSKLIKQQWNISHHRDWKNTEFWPKNECTKNSQLPVNKIYFYCNPHNILPEYHCNFNLVIYTDYDSQQKLAHYKKAHWHYQTTATAVNNKFSEGIKSLRDWQRHYNNIKDSTWPKCLSFRKISTLPHYIQAELSSDPYTSKFLNYQYVEKSAIYQNTTVYAPMLPFLQSANITILLQDLVNSQAEILVKLGIVPNINQAQIDLLDHWKSLHTRELLESIGIVTE